MTKAKTDPAPDAPGASAPATGYLVVSDDVEGFRKGQLAPDTPEIAARLDGKARPATPFDIGVAGATLTREL